MTMFHIRTDSMVEHVGSIYDGYLREPRGIDIVGYLVLAMAYLCFIWIIGQMVSDYVVLG